MRRLLLVTVLLMITCPARGITLSTKPTRNTSVPTGLVAGSGWQWQGNWGNFSGTVISKNTFITAAHVGGHVGDYFTLNGVRYQTTAMFDDPRSDLRIWSIRARLTSAAPLFTGNNETGKGMVVFGRGTQRGAEVIVNNQLKGWQWGADDHVRSWGKNVITGVSAGLADDERTKVPGVRLVWNFDLNGVSHEGGLSLGDSGGGVFMKLGTNDWRLAGVNFAAQSTFSLPGSDEDLHGTIFDAGGLVFEDKLVNDTALNIPTRMYASRISARMPWINDVFAGRVAPNATAITAQVSQGVPEPGVLAGLLAGMTWSLKRPVRRSRLRC